MTSTTKCEFQCTSRDKQTLTCMDGMCIPHKDQKCCMTCDEGCGYRCEQSKESATQSSGKEGL